MPVEFREAPLTIAEYKQRLEETTIEQLGRLYASPPFHARMLREHVLNTLRVPLIKLGKVFCALLVCLICFRVGPSLRKDSKNALHYRPDGHDGLFCQGRMDCLAYRSSKPTCGPLVPQVATSTEVGVSGELLDSNSDMSSDVDPIKPKDLRIVKVALSFASRVAIMWVARRITISILERVGRLFKRWCS